MNSEYSSIEISFEMKSIFLVRICHRCITCCPCRFRSSSSNTMFHFFVSLSFILRSTSIIPFVIIYPFLFYTSSNRLRFLFQAAACFLLLNILNTFIDSYFYDRWTFVPWNFFYMNFLHPNSVSSHYGINHILWYFTNGLPTIFLFRLPFVFLGCLSNKRLTTVIMFTIFIYTLNEHKEFRFLTQILPIIYILEAHGIDWCLKRVRWIRFQWILSLAFVGHLLIGIYFSTMDRQGQISVLHYLRTNVAYEPNRSISVDFLLPCHSTPYTSFLHRTDMKLNFLTCEPNLNARTDNYIDEADRFFSQPKESFKIRLEQFNASHLVMFDTLYEQVKEIIDTHRQWTIKKVLFNSHIQHTSKHGKLIYVLEKQ
jgi:GPI mannosyltransferase 3